MEKVDVFNNILDQDEQILEVFKPNKLRTIFLGIVSRIIASIVPLLFLSAFIIFAVIADGTGGECEINGVPASVEECQGAFKLFYIVPSVIGGIIILFILLRIIAILVSYNKTWFCCTNKRIIIRTGFIGADYQTLDYDLIGGMDVRVDFLDKICKPNTGTITFASAASPVVQKVSSYNFFHIENPYETYKKIKQYCSENKDGKLNS